MTDRSQPRRLRKRWAVLALLILCMLLVIGWHRLWTVGAGRRLNRLVATYRAAGQPIEPEDFVVDDVAPADNAVLDLRAAAAAIDRTTPAWKALSESNDDPAVALRPEELEQIRAVVAANPAALEHLEAAAGKRGINWGLRFRTPVISIMLPDLNAQRELATLLKYDALLAHTDGDHARAVRRVGEMLFLARAVGRQPILVSHLVSIGIGAMATDLLTQMAEDLRVGNGPGDATPQQVRELIAALLDESAVAASQRDALLGERMMQLDIARSVASGKMSLNGMAAPGGKGAAAVATAVKPMALDDGLISLRFMTQVMEAATAAKDWPGFQRVAPALPAEVKERPWRHMVASTFIPSLDRAVQTHFRGLTERRIAAVVLALRLYAAEHDGELPASLDALVPQYLPAVPLDPMAAARPLKYVAGSDPLVYSVGEDGADNGGSEQTKPTFSSPYPDRWDRVDAVWHYRRQPRRVPPPPEDDGVGGFNVAPPPATSPATRAASP